MTFAPDDLMTVRRWLLDRFDVNKGLARAADLDPAEVGVVGDDQHAASGGYHIGNNGLAAVGRLSTDYSKRESARDRPGTNAASALDIGDFDATIAGRRHTLRTLTAGIVAACKAGDRRARDIREIIWSPDGSTVQRWDRLGLRSTGDSTHRWHSHVSFHRDSEGRRHLDDNFLGLLKTLVDGSNTATEEFTMTPEQEALLRAQANNAERDAAAIREMRDTSIGISNTVTSSDQPHKFVQAFKKLAADVAEMKGRAAVDPTAVAAAMVKDTTFITTLAAAVAAQVTLQVGATATQVEEIVGRVVDRELDESFGGAVDKD